VRSDLRGKRQDRRIVLGAVDAEPVAPSELERRVDEQQPDEERAGSYEPSPRKVRPDKANYEADKCGDRRADRCEVVVVPDVEVCEDEHGAERCPPHRKPEPALGAEEGRDGRTSEQSDARRRHDRQPDAGEDRLPRAGVEPLVERSEVPLPEGPLVSHAVVGLAALIASACRVHRTAARRGTATSAAVATWVRRPRVGADAGR
jgi:hypothetical protein